MNRREFVKLAAALVTAPALADLTEPVEPQRPPAVNSKRPGTRHVPLSEPTLFKGARVPTSYIEQFNTTLRLLSQQKKSRLGSLINGHGNIKFDTGL